jgi:hypothetical protein
MDALTAAGSTTWAANIADKTASNVTLTSVEGIDLSSSTGAESVNVTSHAGTRVGEALPASNCVLVNSHVARRYRGGHPRAYLPAGVAADLGSPQTWDTSYLTDVTNGFADLVLDLQNSLATWSTTKEHVNISYYHLVNVAPIGSLPLWKSVLRDTPVIDVVTSSQANPVVGTQRRRLRPG